MNYNRKQCNQIGRHFAIWATLGYSLFNQFSQQLTLLTNGDISNFQEWFDVDISEFQIKCWCKDFTIFWLLFQKIGLNIIQFSGHTGRKLLLTLSTGCSHNVPAGFSSAPATAVASKVPSFATEFQVSISSTFYTHKLRS